MGPDGDWHGGPFGRHGGPHWSGGGPRGGPDPGWFWHFGWLPLVVGVVGAVLVLGLLWRTGRLAALSAGLPRPAAALAAPEPWQRALDRYQALAREYAAFECDPRAVLDLPALADVRQPATARFVDAFAEATALCTARRPPQPLDRQFAGAVERAERAWAAATAAARRIGSAGFNADERALLDQLRALLGVVASSPFEAERRAAFEQARRRFADLERATGWRLPGQAAQAVENRVRGELARA